MIRHVYRREVNPTGSISSDLWPAAFDLSHASWAASVETLQIDLVASGWMNLFTAMLMAPPEVELRWAGVGPGTNAEIKRAYSALMGRFFGRATLRFDHGCRWLRQVVDGLELAPGVHLCRRPGHLGDLPDWVGWDDFNDCWVVAEAKGSHDQGDWLTVIPPPIKTALKQLARVQIVDASGPIAFKRWAVACRWGTEANLLPPMIITCDPDDDGRQLEEWEVSKVREESRARWVADLLDGLGRPDIAAVVRSSDLDGASATEDNLVAIPKRSGYAALAIEAGGLIPLIGPDRGERAAALLETARILKRGTAIVMLDRSAVESAIMRTGPDDRLDANLKRAWWADGHVPAPVPPDLVEGVTGPVRTRAVPPPDVPKPTDLTVDGLTFRTEVDDIGFLEVETSA